MNRRCCEACEALAGLLRYPGGGYRERVRACVEALAGADEEAAARLASFEEGVRGLGDGEIEELYSRSFDLDPACSLDVGWHLYGEAYERGRFLVAVRGLLREHGVAEGTELPDHLGHLLPLLARMGPEAASELARQALAPALAVMCAALENTPNPYRHVLEAVRTLVNTVAIEGNTIAEASEVRHE